MPSAAPAPGERRPTPVPTPFRDLGFRRWIGAESEVDLEAGIGGSVNGGVIATMVDMAAVAASLNGLSPDVEPAGTADLAVTYLRPAFGDWVDATASVIKRGRQLSSIEVKVESSEQKLCAHGRVLYASRVSSN